MRLKDYIDIPLLLIGILGLIVITVLALTSCGQSRRVEVPRQVVKTVTRFLICMIEPPDESIKTVDDLVTYSRKRYLECLHRHGDELPEK